MKSTRIKFFRVRTRCGSPLTIFTSTKPLSTATLPESRMFVPFSFEPYHSTFNAN